MGNTRVTGKEQYYTPRETARSVMERVLTHVEDFQKRAFLEPAAGTGTFLEAAKIFGFASIVAFDSEPKHPEIQKQSFLEADLSLSGAVCITNPPFGRNNSLSIPFFNLAAIYCDVIAFIVPRSWRKWTIINKLNREFRLVDDWNLQVDYLDEHGKESHGAGNLRTCVQVWKRDSQALRRLVKIPDHGLIVKTTPAKADVSFTLFGYGCGTVKQKFSRVSNTTQAFFKLHHSDALKALQSVDYSLFYQHTAYVQALSMQEINFLLNDYLELESMRYSLDVTNANYLGLEYEDILSL